MNEHDYEPIPGLPAPLPAGETILWQGAPCWETLAWRAMRVPQISIYFAILAAWGLIAGISAGTQATELALSTLRLVALAGLAVGLLALFACLVARTTLYTITTRRVVMRFGIALPMTLQIPFRMIEGADLRVWANGAGDVALSLQAGQRVAYLVLWPHARPWKVTRPVPSLRAVPDAAAVGQILGRALAASASQAAVPVTVVTAAETANGSHLPAAA
jgi:hypothetical protein